MRTTKGGVFVIAERAYAVVLREIRNLDAASVDDPVGEEVGTNIFRGRHRVRHSWLNSRPIAQIKGRNKK